MLEAAPLAGMGVLVTRPAHQARRLAHLIEAAGGRPILFPVLEILDIEDLQPLHALIDRLEIFDLAIFISPNAVAKAMTLIQSRRGGLPENLRVAAVGKGSLKELKNFGVAEALVPEARFDSEGLLDLPELQDMAGKKVVIFRGDGGREVLGDTLVARGALLEYAECYRRARPDADAGVLLRLWADDGLDAVTVTSSESLRNLFDLVGDAGRPWLKKTPVFAPHERIAQAARELGVEQAVATGAGDEGLVASLIEWRRKRKA